MAFLLKSFWGAQWIVGLLYEWGAGNGIFGQSARDRGTRHPGRDRFWWDEGFAWISVADGVSSLLFPCGSRVGFPAVSELG